MKKWQLTLWIIVFSFVSYCGNDVDNVKVNFGPCADIEIPADAPKSIFIDYNFPHRIDQGKTAAVSLALDAEDNAHIAYFVYGEAKKAELRYATNKNGKWEISVLDSEVRFDDISRLGVAIMIDDENKAHIIYSENYWESEINIFILNYLTNTSSKWTKEIIEKGEAGPKISGISTTSEASLSLVTDKNKVMHLSYTTQIVSGVSFVNRTLRHAWRTKGEFGQKWQLEDILATNDENVEIYPSRILIDSQNYLNIVYCRTDTQDLSYITNANPDEIWGVGVVVPGDCLGAPSFIIDKNSRFHIAYYGTDLAGTTVLKYGNNADQEWKFYVIAKSFGEMMEPFNLAVNGNSIALALLRSENNGNPLISDPSDPESLCTLPDSPYYDPYFRIFFNLETISEISSAVSSALYPYNGRWTGFQTDLPLQFFDLGQDNAPRFVISSEKNVLFFGDGSKEKLEAKIEYLSLSICSEKPKCFLKEIAPYGCEFEDKCAKRYADIEKWLWPEGKKFISELPISVYIFPEEIFGTACTSEDCGACYPCCADNDDCDDEHYCTTDVCLPEQICIHTLVSECCESDAECNFDDNPNTIDKCIDHQCQMVCIYDCTNKECGDDGCGGSCGKCYGQDKCEDGKCVCQSDCVGKECGDDGCGGSCGECGENQYCDSNACQCFKECGEGNCYAESFSCCSATMYLNSQNEQIVDHWGCENGTECCKKDCGGGLAEQCYVIGSGSCIPKGSECCYVEKGVGANPPYLAEAWYFYIGGYCEENYHCEEVWEIDNNPGHNVCCPVGKYYNELQHACCKIGGSACEPFKEVSPLI